MQNRKGMYHKANRGQTRGIWEEKGTFLCNFYKRAGITLHDFG